MRNCFFEDDDLVTTVRPASFIKKDKDGYFIKIKINKTDVVKVMMLGLVPTFIKDSDMFVLSVSLTNATRIRVNGMRVNSLNLDDNRLQQMPISLVSIRELGIKKYSKNTDFKHRQCYATTLVMHIKVPSKARKRNENAQSS